ncbi:hypothetical protein MAPG_05523 [Magnaporthiopsis poae ATCC 64411]|uniref:Uncharacterized protein n=1 Tax=Magnaporthiopsis poae (strain ATCC 64411 / 73-15) TaxID=644358 RepID=A0A0C4DZL8_MAGP6|nr:hypothetical protein MAPG_05523 [Magnaporthiopsis poae ATCC 64411]
MRWFPFPAPQMHTRNKGGRHPRQKRLAPISLRESSRQRRTGVDRREKSCNLPSRLHIPTPPVLSRSSARLSLQAEEPCRLPSAPQPATSQTIQPSKSDPPQQAICLFRVVLASIPSPSPELVTNCTLVMNQHSCATLGPSFGPRKG